MLGECESCRLIGPLMRTQFVGGGAEEDWFNLCAGCHSDGLESAPWICLKNEITVGAGQEREEERWCTHYFISDATWAFLQAEQDTAPCPNGCEPWPRLENSACGCIRAAWGHRPFWSLLHKCESHIRTGN